MDDIRAAFALDPDFLTVNHGSFGAAPRRVLAAQAAWRVRLEAQPSRFMVEVLTPALRAAAADLAGFLGADADGLGFVDNATAACNAMLRSVRFAPGEEILLLSHAYGAVRKTAAHVAAAAEARLVEAPLPFPRPTAEAVLESLVGAITPRTRLAVLDHITSPSALILPIEAMVAACQARGVPVLVDGAHGPAQVTLSLAALGADWYAGNCHKWLMAPKGCGFLWTAPSRRAETHAPIISHGLGEGYLAEFDWTGTRDPSAHLSVTEAIAALEAFGGAALMARNRAMALAAGQALAARLKTETGALPAMAGSMATVRLPIPGAATRETALALRARLLRAGTDAPVTAIDGAHWLRLSVAAYNRAEDYDRLGDIVESLL
ncbi:MAG: aminotransferase class V-fold PLP-dependent enzyme [Paracraurococcus sp.]